MSRAHARELPPRSLGAGKPLPLGVEPESPRPHRGDRHQNCAMSRVKLGLGSKETSMHRAHWTELACCERPPDRHTSAYFRVFSTRVISHVSTLPRLSTCVPHQLELRKFLLHMCQAGNTASMQPHLIAVRGCRGQDNAVLVLGRARASPVQQERGQAQHDRQHHRCWYDRRHDDGAARRAAGRRRRRRLPGACAGEQAKG